MENATKCNFHERFSNRFENRKTKKEEEKNKTLTNSNKVQCSTQRIHKFQHIYNGIDVSVSFSHLIPNAIAFISIR